MATAQEVDAWVTARNQRLERSRKFGALAFDTARTMRHAAEICRRQGLVNIAAALDEQRARWEELLPDMNTPRPVGRPPATAATGGEGGGCE